MTKRIDISGQKFGRLTAIRFSHVRIKKSVWEFICDCGNIHVAYASLVKRGVTSSCGCFYRENHTTRAKKHGKTYTAEYRSWYAMKARCKNEKNKSYEFYGGRGISVCERWIKSFENFFADMGHKPSPKHSIDRIDNNGNYEPTNCKWSTPSEQVKNRRRLKPLKGRKSRKRCLL
jgi:hypothetical protein